MKLLLSQLKNGYVYAPAATNDENEVFEKKMICCTCGTETSVTRIEQFIIKPDTEVVLAKCIDCLIDTLKGDQTEFQLLLLLIFCDDFNRYLAPKSVCRLTNVRKMI